MEGVTSDILISDSLLDFWHVTGDTFVASAANLMMRMCFDARRVGPRLCVRAVTVETQRIARLAHHGDILGAMRIVAAGTGDSARIHQALHKIIALHAVLVRGAIREVRKGEFAK